MAHRDYRLQSFLSFRHAHGNLCKHLGIDLNTDSYINRHAHIEYLKKKMIEFFSLFGIWHVFSV